jgi:acetylornithine deacetylase
MTPYTEKAVALLQDLIQTPSFSKEEDKTADIISVWMKYEGISYQRKLNNIWCTNLHFSTSKPTILLNSHHDTVKPNSGYTRDPFGATIENDCLFGLGSNDAGGCLVSLLLAFSHYYTQKDLPFNLLFAATAEEEISGKNGIESIHDLIAPISFGIIGEPTKMEMAVAEKGLIVLDCYAKGVAGHAARDIGTNAIYIALEAINWFRTYSFANVSPYLGPIKMSTTIIQAGSQHNVIPDSCHFVVDIRSTDAYTHEEILEIISANVNVEVAERSLRLRPSGLPNDHILRQVAEKLEIPMFGSPTTSDQAICNFHTIKMGPGDSERSHTADEYIFIKEIERGINGYIDTINEVSKIMAQ